jgi:excisionase family DNA binding protein
MVPMPPPSEDRPDRLLTIAELAAYLNVSTGWVRAGVLNRTLPHTKIGRGVRFTPVQVQQIVEAGDRPSLNQSAARRGSARTRL